MGQTVCLLMVGDVDVVSFCTNVGYNPSAI